MLVDSVVVIIMTVNSLCDPDHCLYWQSHCQKKISTSMTLGQTKQTMILHLLDQPGGMADTATDHRLAHISYADVGIC